MMDTFNHGEHAGLLERLGRLAGQTTHREPTARGSRRTGDLTHENVLCLALAMARRHSDDYGPDIAYTVATGHPYRKDEIVEHLRIRLSGDPGARKCEMDGSPRIAAQLAYGAIMGFRGQARGKDAEIIMRLAKIGAGWLWTSMERSLDRAEQAMRSHG